ncbi:ABC transporter ATP-binding protein [Porphyromonas sp. COT-290 OH3588]|uniref:ABC transporter ATP-binding protein n=1 Tax=Porphyromonas sp. COT-290 OH3588 TaxID=1515617 RepID=UPI000694B930|nr:ABC transporter ATP-binding protein [Porphyromonas sp. COT-290 OH3588]
MLEFVRYLVRGYKWSLILMILVGFAYIAVALLFVWLGKCVIDIATGDMQGSWVQYSIWLIITLAAQALLRLCNIWLTGRTSTLMGNTIRHKVFSHLLYARWQSLGQIHSGDMLTRIIKDTDDLVMLLTSALPNFILSGAQLAASLVMLYVLSPVLAIILGVGMPLVLLFSKAFYRRMLDFSNQIKQTESRINSQMQEALGNQTVIRTFERQEAEIDHLRLNQGKLYRNVRQRIGLTIYANMMVSAAFSGGYIIAFLWSAYGLKHGTITFGMMTIFLQLVNRIQRPMIDLMGSLPTIIASKAGIDRLVNLLEFKVEQRDKRTLLSEVLRLRASQVSFRYEEDSPWVFRDFEMSVEAGSMVAVMGRTGAGKTTLLRLLLGLVHPTEGRLELISEQRTLRISEATRSNFIYVPQGNSLFSGTIRDNLLVGDATADDRRLREVLSIASADFVFDLPHGLDTVLGERGAGLSEGQAQRIAIARSLLRPGRILLLDEATSALDGATEQAFLKNLRQHLGGRIILFITHHSAVAEACDQVIHL